MVIDGGAFRSALFRRPDGARRGGTIRLRSSSAWGTRRSSPNFLTGAEQDQGPDSQRHRLYFGGDPFEKVIHTSADSKITAKFLMNYRVFSTSRYPMARIIPIGGTGREADYNP